MAAAEAVDIILRNSKASFDSAVIAPLQPFHRSHTITRNPPESRRDGSYALHELSHFAGAPHRLNAISLAASDQ